MYDINIVANHATILAFRNLKKFQLDLGKSLIDRQTKNVNVEDNFLAYQMFKQQRMVYKIGKLGKAGFYYDNSLKNNKIEIYFDTQRYENELDSTNVEKWLTDKLIEIEQQIVTEAD